MARVLKIVKVLKNNWKKSVFFCGVSIYAIKYIERKTNENETRKLYCEFANKCGNENISFTEKPRRLMVFLNPAASEGSGRKLFEKNAAPILQLAGFDVHIVKTEYEGQAKEFMSALEVKDTDLIVVAGGDGLLSEVVSGIMKKNDTIFEKKIPIAVIPVGKTNRFFRLLFGEQVDTVKGMCEAALAVIQGRPIKVDVLQILGSDGKETFALSGLEFGSFRDAEARKSKYWYFGPLKSRWTHLRTLMKQWPPTFTAHISYISAEDAERARLDALSESKMTTVTPQRKSWSWKNIFYRSKPIGKSEEMVNNDEHSVGDEWLQEMELTATDFAVTSSNYSTDSEGRKSIDVSIGPSEVSKREYFQKVMQHLKSSPLDLGMPSFEHLSVEKIKFIPNIQKGDTRWYSIDGEQYEAKPISIQLLRNRLTFLTAANSLL